MTEIRGEDWYGEDLGAVSYADVTFVDVDLAFYPRTSTAERTSVIIQAGGFREHEFVGVECRGGSRTDLDGARDVQVDLEPGIEQA